jgi:hypothetical protein
MKAKCANQNETLVAGIGDAGRNVLVLTPEFDRKISESLSPVIVFPVQVRLEFHLVLPKNHPIKSIFRLRMLNYLT